MSDRTWDGESDFRPRGGGALAAFGKWLGRLSFIGLLTLGVAYYLPLYKAHRVLTEKQRETTSELRRLTAKLTTTETDLTTARAAVASVKERDDAAREKETIAKSELDSAVARVATKLARLTSRNVVAVAAHDGSLVATYAATTATGVEALPAAGIATRLGLCDVSAALLGAHPGAPLSVTVFADGGAAAPAATRFEAASRRATKLVDALESTCRVPTGSAFAVVRDPSSDDQPGGVEVRVSLGT